MLPVQLGTDRERLRVLCIGAHSDDIEIGCAATLLRWLQMYRGVEITWAVLSAADSRGKEARRSARALLRSAASLDLILGDFRDSYLPADYARVKTFFSELHRRSEPDVVLTHRLEDRHQDHRLVAELTWQTWRDHLILEYEIPKYEGDLGQPNFYTALPAAVARRKVRHLLTHFASQRSKGWFTEETFLSLMRLRGIECRAPDGFGEAFHVRKLVL
jgi:LmbE family N-acetylglucosaminyl deacetylase